MLKPHPTVLRRLVEEYETLTAAPATASGSRIADLAYTLCVSTGTRDVGNDAGRIRPHRMASQSRAPVRAQGSIELR